MWCPNCQNEYREGITICPECNIALIEELKEEVNLVEAAGVKDEILKDKIIKYLDHLNINNSCSVKEDEEGEKQFIISVAEDKLNEAMNVIATIVKVESEKKIAEDPEKALAEAKEIIEEAQNAADKKGFMKASERSSDYTSSGYLFMIFGVLLGVFAALNMTGVLTMFSGTFSLIMLIALGALFLIYGAYSIKKGSSLKSEIAEEKDTEEKVKAFIHEYITKEKLDELNDDDTTPELLYLRQSDYIKDEILKAFPDTNEEYADMLTEEFLNEIYND